MAPPNFRRTLDASARIQDQAEIDFENLAEALAENIGRRIAASLGIDPSSIFPPDGSDGRLVGRTNFERVLQSVSGDDAVRAVVLSSDIDDIEDFIAQSGSLAARDALTRAVSDLAGLAEQSLVAQGIAAKGALDTVAAEALIGSYITNTMDEALRSTIDRPAAVRIRQGIVANIGQMSIAEVAQVIAEEQLASVPRATTEARTQLAEADRFVHETVRKSIDPDGDKFLIGYIGPDDRITRPFCNVLVNKAFKISDFNQLRNGQTATHPRISGGGYNCRHDVRPVLDDDKVLSDLRLQRGTLADIRQANEVARPKKRKKKGSRRR
jgi:hypothetical protein